MSLNMAGSAMCFCKPVLIPVRKRIFSPKIKKNYERKERSLLPGWIEKAVTPLLPSFSARLTAKSTIATFDCMYPAIGWYVWPSYTWNQSLFSFLQLLKPDVKVIIVKIDTCRSICGAADIDNPSLWTSGQDLPKQQISQKEMTKIICRKLRFNPIVGFWVWASHDGRIVDQNVEFFRSLLDDGCCFPDGVLRAKININKFCLNSGINFLNLINHR